MKFQGTPEEETQQFKENTPDNFNLNQEQLNQKIIAQDKPKFIYVNPSIYLMYCLLNGFSILLGCFMKLIYPISRDTIGKKSILTGIPLIRNNYFIGPIILNLVYFIWCIYNFYSSKIIKMSYQNSLMKYLKEIRGVFFFTNILLLMIFYALYYYVVIPTFHSFQFKLSGHVIASILSGGMIVNLHNIYEPFMKNAKNFNNYIFYANMFLYYHSIYTIFWSSWIFHHIKELVFAYIISVFSLILAHSINIDELILNLIDFRHTRKNPVILYISY